MAIAAAGKQQSWNGPSRRVLFVAVAAYALVGSIVQAEDEHGPLDNVIEVVPGVINGSAPEGEAGFEALAGMGVKTIVCVDGAVPDASAAAKRGMRYVHLPIGYDGIEAEQGLLLLRAVRDLPRPIYVHCHHGMHRSPAASAYVSVGLGMMTPAEGVSLMKRAGTSPEYPGLYLAVERAKAVSAERIDAVSADFPSRASPGAFVDLMVAMDRAFDHLEQCQRAGWAAPSDAPDLSPAHEAKILEGLVGRVEGVRQIEIAKSGRAGSGRLEKVYGGDGDNPSDALLKSGDEILRYAQDDSAGLGDDSAGRAVSGAESRRREEAEFTRMIGESMLVVRELSAVLEAGASSGSDGADLNGRRNAAMEAVSASCRACHKVFRNPAIEDGVLRGGD